MTSQTKALADEADRVALRGYIKDSVATLPSELLNRILAALRAEPAGEPVAWRSWEEDDPAHWVYYETAPHYPEDKVKWRPLYTHPPSPSALAEGWVAVPKEPTKEMLVVSVTQPMSMQGNATETIRYHLWQAMLDARPPVAGEAK